MELRKTFRFEASHILPKHPGKCSRLHGHSWVLHVYVEGPINMETGFVQDYADISAVVKPIIDELDHKHLGAWTSLFAGIDRAQSVRGLPDDFYPSSENLLCWLALQMYSLDIWQIDGKIVAPNLYRPGAILPAEDPNSIKLLSHWSKLQLEETCTSLATLTRTEFNGSLPTPGR